MVDISTQASSMTRKTAPYYSLPDAIRGACYEVYLIGQSPKFIAGWAQGCKQARGVWIMIDPEIRVSQWLCPEMPTIYPTKEALDYCSYLVCTKTRYLSVVRTDAAIAQEADDGRSVCPNIQTAAGDTAV